MSTSIAYAPSLNEYVAKNLGHDSMLTTFASYGQVPSLRQAEIIRGLARPRGSNDDLATAIRQVVAAHERG